MEPLFRIVGKHWPLVKRGGKGWNYTFEGEMPHTIAETKQWRKGPKCHFFYELLCFRGFSMWVVAPEKDNPDLYKMRGSRKAIGEVEEIISPNKAKFTAVGILNIQIEVRSKAESEGPPLMPDEIRQAGEIIDVLEGRRDATKEPRKGRTNSLEKLPYPTKKIAADTYGVKILELIPKYTDRVIGKIVRKWAVEKAKTDEDFKLYSVYGESWIEKYAGVLRREKQPKRLKR